MCIDGHPMGSEIAYRDEMKLTLRLGDFFEKLRKANTVYELRIVTDQGIAYRSDFNGKYNQKVELKVQKRAFYRAEVYDKTQDCIFALGNPIWLS